VFPRRNNYPGGVREIGLKNGRNPGKKGVLTGTGMGAKPCMIVALTTDVGHYSGPRIVPFIY